MSLNNSINCMQSINDFRGSRVLAHPDFLHVALGNARRGRFPSSLFLQAITSRAVVSLHMTVNSTTFCKPGCSKNYVFVAARHGRGCRDPQTVISPSGIV
jgi:hypothetical protein